MSEHLQNRVTPDLKKKFDKNKTIGESDEVLKKAKVLLGEQRVPNLSKMQSFVNTWRRKAHYEIRTRATHFYACL